MEYKREPITFKNSIPSHTRLKDLPINEAYRLHREAKKDLLDLLDVMSMPNYTKDRIKDELFKIFLKLK